MENWRKPWKNWRKPWKTCRKQWKTMEKLKKAMEKLKNTMENLQKTMENWRKLLKIEENHGTIEENYGKLKKTMDKLKKTMEHLKKTMEHLKKTMEKLKTTMEKLKKTMEKLKRHETQTKIQNCKKKSKNNSAPHGFSRLVPDWFPTMVPDYGSRLVPDWFPTGSRFANLGSHLITKNAHIPLSSTKRYFHGHTLFSRSFALCRLQFHVFHGFPRLFNVFPRPNLVFTAVWSRKRKPKAVWPNGFEKTVWPWNQDIAVKTRFGREKVCIWPWKNVEWPWKPWKTLNCRRQCEWPCKQRMAVKIFFWGRERYCMCAFFVIK